MAIINKAKLGTILVEKRIITNEELQESLAAQQGSALRLGQVLIKKGLATEFDIIKGLAEYYGLDSEQKLDFDDPEALFKDVPVHFLKRNNIVPYKVHKNKILVAVSDALNIQPMDDLKMLFPDYELDAVLAPENEVQRIIASYYDRSKNESTSDVIEDLEESDFEILSSQFNETEDILDMANDAPIIRLVNTIIKQAVSDRASDIHFEPYEKDLSVRFRVDGMLFNMYTPPKKYQGAIISRIKIMSNLNIAENRLPQDGRIQLKIGGKDIDIRVSVFPTYYGERVVLRLLNKTDMVYDLNSLGFDKNTFDRFNELIKKTHGIILVTGPTGSGKSTTLYSVLTRLNNPDVNILTVEDPIEYQIHGVGQMQIKPSINLTFASGLRAILRQDPDIVMIGEIRDVETAEIAIQSALTGHRVFSTLHTNDAASGVTRLLDMGVEPFLIASSVNAFLAQRLIRKICSSCRESYKPSKALLNEFNLKSSKLKNGKLYRGRGCDKCLGTGYSGRVGIYELLTVTKNIRQLVMENADASRIKDTALNEGMATLLEDGFNKAIQGVTTVEEVLRVS